MILLLAVFSGCSQTERTADHELLDEYLLLNYDSWNRTKNSIQDLTSHYQVGDTLTLKFAATLMIIPNDSIQVTPISPENFREFLPQTKIKLTWVNTDKPYNHFFHFSTIDADSATTGIATARELKSTQTDPDLLKMVKEQKLEQIFEQRELFNSQIKDLAARHGMTEDALLAELARQYFEVTGKPIFTN
ncbi:MAG: hypothetical protein RIF40_27110 [Imperialibacter sp.]|uniref:hypothetical protein n=1 Tax=Imperialibacter sp. TaxID=2038411 RepID=UPI0032EF3A3A